jgi:hypothetical protein
VLPLGDVTGLVTDAASDLPAMRDLLAAGVRLVS